jgi:hypothetical protein
VHRLEIPIARGDQCGATTDSSGWARHLR